MDLNLDWTNDPIVRLEDELFPAVWLPADYLMGTASLDDVLGTLARARDILNTFGALYLEPTGVALPKDQRDLCTSAAKICESLHQDLRTVSLDDAVKRRKLWRVAHEDLRPALLACVNAIRETFLTVVLQRQADHANHSERSIAELSLISKKIFFVAINASVEAARVGDHGVGFSYISSEIRQLSQSAQVAIDKMRVDLH